MKKSFLKWGFIILWTVGLGVFLVQNSKIDSVKVKIDIIIKYNDEKNEIKKNEIEYKKERELSV